MTNAIVTMKLAAVLSTNWVTVSTTIPIAEPGIAFHAVYRPVMSNQSGTITSNTVGTFLWKGQERSVVLDATVIGTVERSVDSNFVR